MIYTILKITSILELTKTFAFITLKKPEVVVYFYQLSGEKSDVLLTADEHLYL